jgi:hypothetical protein
MSDARAYAASRIIVRLIALLVALPSTFLIWIGLEMFKPMVISDSSLVGGLFGVGFEVITVAIPAWCLYVAYHGLFLKSATSVRRVCGAFAFIVFYFVQGPDRASGGDAPPGHPDFKMTLFYASIAIAIAVYLLLIGLLLPRVGLCDDRSPTEQRRHVSRLFGYLSLTIFLGGLALTGVMSPPLPRTIPDATLYYGMPVVVLLPLVVYGVGPRIFWRVFSAAPAPTLESLGVSQQSLKPVEPL